MKKTNEAQPPIEGGILRAQQEHQQGAVISEMSAKLRTITNAAATAGKPASMTLKITILPQGNAVAFMAEVDTKLPKSKPFAGVFFSDEDGNLYRNDPAQPALPALKTVETEQPIELKKAVNQ